MTYTDQEIDSLVMTPGLVVMVDMDTTAALTRRLKSLLESKSSAYQAWQPIETAPRDGTRILAVIDRRNIGPGGGWYGPNVEITCWDSIPECNWDKPLWLDMNGYCSIHECFRPYHEEDVRITHWMPLPEEPK